MDVNEEHTQLFDIHVLKGAEFVPGRGDEGWRFQLLRKLQQKVESQRAMGCRAPHGDLVCCGKCNK